MIRVFLVGYMGVGKTTIGKLLSAELGVEFIDLDRYIENRYRKSISQLFELKGEDGFRKIEREMLREIATFQNVLISTGGGTPCFFDNMDLMNKHGITVYVKASVEELTARLLASKNARPLIRDKSHKELKEFITQHLAERSGYYSKAKVIYENKRLISFAHVNESVADIKKMIQPYI
ncbi:MAG: shikimate kinase [Dysgonamonadaceae bacterium]|jgi:shikimate kinase|nr:shikimate kinase [Dysgonamonadaceae bacterium]MDD3356526.1 shikimate kinase [Dysgonamonadaceae bacterium]MDD3728533.1 shikimate kinase [Dysgonamonadaceae bacterium]MDD4246349.1 shikimate kinase [Dysgonamonadaceae bacterium]MDD4605815.1 shikimate kinase [Dysgonamonadaceae bacterium]